MRILVVLHLVLHFCYQAFGPSVFQNLYLRRLAEWGAVQYSTLLCLEGMVLAIRYGRAAKGGEDAEVEAPDPGAFFKRHAMEFYPLYLVAAASTWAFQYVMTGVGSLSQLLLAATLVDVSELPGLLACFGLAHWSFLCLLGGGAGGGAIDNRCTSPRTE